MNSLPLIIYFALCGLGSLSVLTLYKNKSKIYNTHLWLSAMLLYTNVVAENLYYGLARLSPEMYTAFSWFWPAVLVFKVAYAVSFFGIIFSLLGSKDD